MYSPKISEKHIPVLYQLGKRMKKPMTFLVNEAVTEYIGNRVKMASGESAAR